MRMHTYITCPKNKIWLVNANLTTLLNPEYIEMVQASGNGVSVTLLDVPNAIQVPNITVREFLSSMKAIKYTE